ncbi:hypothetical protein MTR62_12035 [Novosphingobium sp. 1949]|uniref:UrcA family protein n=1 Tax=Novosphingobium organovorum TaxID=2930092 RepID=A0ABT0BEC9_9SPHN|nr:hypothetical protein [Novosphingobium organovorum]MCJ2183412.1 hypothetical protein [Novosphingobium organovorum]
MSILILAAAAAASLPVHSVALEQDGQRYTVDYIAHLSTRSKVEGVRPPSRGGFQRCVTKARLSVERRITDPASGASMSAMLPGETQVSDSRVGRCGAFDERADDLVAARADTITAHLTRTAAADKPHALATITAARSLAAR